MPRLLGPSLTQGRSNLHRAVLSIMSGRGSNPWAEDDVAEPSSNTRYARFSSGKSTSAIGRKVRKSIKKHLPPKRATRTLGNVYVTGGDTASAASAPEHSQQQASGE